MSTNCPLIINGKFMIIRVLKIIFMCRWLKRGFLCIFAAEKKTTERNEHDSDSTADSHRGSGPDDGRLGAEDAPAQGEGVQASLRQRRPENRALRALHMRQEKMKNEK
jgi:hypothetical protein